MATVAAHLTDRVLPWLPVRQWVLSVPKRLRPHLHDDSEVASGVLRIFLRAIRSTLRATSPGAPESVPEIRIGAITAGGAEIAFRPSELYAEPPAAVPFANIEGAARARGEIALGIRRRGSAPPLELVPPRASRSKPGPELEVVVLVREEATPARG